jgi:hypothetical protein
MDAIFVGLAASVAVSLILSALTSVARRLTERSREASEKERRAIITEVIATSPQVDHGTDVGIVLSDLASYLSTSTRQSASKEEIREEVRSAVISLQDRLERIEQRFPEEATLEKITSINDAILATKVEQLQKSIEQIESIILTKWDVATIVFAVFAAIGGVAGVIFAVANFVLK